MTNAIGNGGEIIMYESEDGSTRLAVQLDSETVWLTQAQIAELFGVNPQAISKHLSNIFEEGELDFASTCSKMEQVRTEGKRKVRRTSKFYNLDAVISVGYRVNSKRADADKEFMGMTSFKGTQPTLADARVAKNYLDERELKVLNNLVSAFFDLAELDAVEHRALYMRDYVERLDAMFSAAGRKILENAGSKSHREAMERVEAEYRKYQVRTLSPVEKAYLNSLKDAANQLPPA